MKKYHVYANDGDFGIVEAENEQEAKDKVSQDAGYASEADQVERLEQPSDMVAIEVE